MTQVQVQPVSSVASLERAISNIRTNVPLLDPYNTRIVLYINGQHYQVTSASLCDGRLELDYNHATPLD